MEIRSDDGGAAHGNAYSVHLRLFDDNGRASGLGIPGAARANRVNGLAEYNF
jgi:hypothetical protein